MQEAIAARILQLCAERRINPHRLARMAAIPPTTLKNILSGASQQPGVVVVKKICDGLDISMHEFFSHELFRELEKKKPFPLDGEEDAPILVIHDAISKRLSLLARENNLAFRAWARRAELSESAVKNILYDQSKNTSMVVLKNLCDVIDLPLEEFFDHELFHSLDPEIEHEQDEEKP